MNETRNIAAASDGQTVYKGRSLAQETWRRFLKNKGALVGMIFMILLVILACAGDIIYDYDTDVIGFSADLSKAPSLNNPFGADQLGRDILSRVV